MGPETQQQLSDFVGEHGPYQLILTVILFMRYVLLGLMANSGSLMAPDVTFYCELPMDEIVAIMPNITLLNRTEQELEIREEFKQICQLDLHLYQQAYLNASLSGTATSAQQVGSSSQQQQQQQQQLQQIPAAVHGNAELAAQLKRQARFNVSNRIRECTDFRYDIAPDQGRTMTSEFDLVCERDWLRSLFQSLISAAIVVAHVFWGTFSDNYGRYKAQKICLLVSFLFGLLSVLPVDFWTFTIARALCSFGDLGLVVSLTTTVVELVGNQYRGLSVALVNFGYALGVTVLPYIVAYFEDFRTVVGFTVFCHLLTVPFILATNESVRWLLTNRKFKLARRELKRIARFNRGSQYCCSFWPISELVKRTKYGQHNQLNRETSSHESKQAFDVLFRKFIEQIESQKLCDPEQDDNDSSRHKSESENNNNNNNDDNNTNRQECRRCESNTTCGSIKDSPTVADTDLDAVIVGGCDGASCITASASDSPDQTNGSTPNCADNQGLLVQAQQNSTPAMGNDQKALTDQQVSFELGPKLIPGGYNSGSARSSSCDQLWAARLVDTYEPASTRAAQHSLVGRTSSSTGFLPASGQTFPTIGQSCRARLAAEVEHQQRQRQSADDKLTSSAAETIIGRRHRATANHQPDCINLVAHQLSFIGRVSRLFKDKILMIAVFTIVWTTFNSELQYTSFIIINLEVGEDVYLNYMLGGCMEALAAITASLLLSYASRRHSLICFWLLISASCFGLSVAHIDSTWAVWLLALAKFSQSCLSSIASVAAYEAFPTFLRQSGSGLVFTLGGLGSVFAPLIFAEFDDHAGMDRVLMTFSFSSLTAATLIYLFLKETRNCELQ